MARASAFSFGLVYGSVKLKILKVANSILTCLTFLDYPYLFLLWVYFKFFNLIFLRNDKLIDFHQQTNKLIMLQNLIKLSLLLVWQFLLRVLHVSVQIRFTIEDGAVFFRMHDA